MNLLWLLHALMYDAECNVRATLQPEREQHNIRIEWTGIDTSGELQRWESVWWRAARGTGADRATKLCGGCKITEWQLRVCVIQDQWYTHDRHSCRGKLIVERITRGSDSAHFQPKKPAGQADKEQQPFQVPGSTSGVSEESCGLEPFLYVLPHFCLFGNSASNQ